MLSMESSLSSPNSVMEADKPRAPRFEAYVMTGDAILNLSRTTHSSPGFFPVHSRRRRCVQSSNSVPTSPSDLIQPGKKPWEQDVVEPDTFINHSSVSSVVVENSKAGENLNGPVEAVIECQTKTTEIAELKTENTEIIVNKTEKTDMVEFKIEKSVTQESSSNTSPTEEDGKNNERIVWTYNAPLTEQEMRRLQAEEFWMSRKQEAPLKQFKQFATTDVASEINTGDGGEQIGPTPTESTNVGSDTRMDLMCVGKAVDTGAKKDEVKDDDTSPSEDQAGISLRSSLSKTTTDEESDADSLQSVHYSPKGVDMPSAIRLAKRLFALDGFQKSDVSRHLSKNNDFNRVVAEEYLKHFSFENISLDGALRRFLQAFQLTGESSERDRVLVHFSRRFLQCNPNSFASQDGVHILTCALLLLNSDLHGKHQGIKRMTCAQFIKRLSGLNDGGNFPVDLLRRLYNSIKEHPLEWATDSHEPAGDAGIEPIEAVSAPKELPSNPYLDIPAPTQSQEFKKGYVMRKCCMEPNGKRTALGKRGWKMYFAVLKDLVLYLYKDEATCKGELPPKVSTQKKKSTSDPGPASLIRVHHSLAASAPDYNKKPNVFRLFTADRAQYLIQTSDTKEWRGWMDALNTAASLLSSPPLPAPVGSQQRFQRPLLPAGLTKLAPRDQLLDHEERVLHIEQELLDHRANPLPSNAKSAMVNFYREKDAFLHFEKTRYEAYCTLLERAAFGPNMSRDLSLMELDERSDSGRTSPDCKSNEEENSTTS